MFWFYNPNPTGKNVGDCTVRALTKGLGRSWEEIYTALALQGYLMGDLPSANAVWGAYLRQQGWTRRIIPDTCPDCYTVADFTAEHPHGTYILALSGHVVCVSEGDLWDSWDSSGEVPLYYWERNEQ